MQTTVKRIALLVAILAAALGLAGKAAAMTPAQSNGWYLANVIQFNQQTGATPYGSIEHFWMTTLRAWGYNYYRPRLIWYGDYFGNRDSACPDQYGRYSTAYMRNN